MAMRRAGRPEEALAFYESALKLRERLAREQPTDPWIRFNLAVLHYNIGNLRRETGPGGVTEAYERANKILEPLVREYRSIAEFRMQYARSLGNLVLVTGAAKSTILALPAYTQVAELQREEVELHPGVVTFQLDLARTLVHLARSHLLVNQPQDALRHTQEGTERLEAILAADKDPQGQARSVLGMIWEQRAAALVALGRENEAVGALRTAIDHQCKALKKYPRSREYTEELFKHRYHLVALHCLMGQTAEVAASLEAMVPSWPADGEFIFSEANELAHGWPKATNAEGERTALTGTATQRYGALVVTMLERSVNAGFRNFAGWVGATRLSGPFPGAR